MLAEGLALRDGLRLSDKLAERLALRDGLAEGDWLAEDDLDALELGETEADEDREADKLGDRDSDNETDGLAETASRPMAVHTAVVDVPTFKYRLRPVLSKSRKKAP